MAAGGRSHLGWVSSQSAGRFGVGVFVFVESVEAGGCLKDWRRDGGRWRVEVGKGRSSNINGEQSVQPIRQY